MQIQWAGTREEAEAQAGGPKLFADLDKNGDGLLQPQELNGRLGAPVLKAADPDADGALNPQEYAALITACYKSANANSDGLVDGAGLVPCGSAVRYHSRPVRRYGSPCCGPGLG